MKEQLPENGLQESEELYENNRAEESEIKEINELKKKYYKWGGLFFQITTVSIIIRMILKIFELIFYDY